MSYTFVSGKIYATIPSVKRATPWRVELKLANLAMGILLLGLVPYPQVYTFALRQAEAHRAAGEYGAALAAWDQAGRLDPNSPQPWLRAGEVLLRQHRFDRAQRAFQEAGRRHSTVAALLGLGESYAGRGDWAAALKTWGQALALAPDEARVYLALGRGSLAQGHFDQAVSYLTRALRLRPTAAEAAEAHRLLGRLLADDSPELAADHLRQAGDTEMLAVLEAAEAEPDPPHRAILLGAAFLRQSDLPLACRALEQAIALDPTNAEAHAYLAHTLDRLGEAVAAGELLQQALALDPDSALAYYFLGIHERLIGDANGAQAALWEALLRDPENAALRVEMAEAFVDLGDYPHAEEWYQGAVEVAPDDVEFHLLLVHFYLDHLYRVEEGGVPAAEAAAALAPDDARPWDLLGWAYHLVGRHAEGEQALRRALALDPNLVSAHYHLGRLYANTGRRALARQHLQRTADLDTEGYHRERAEALLEELK